MDAEDFALNDSTDAEVVEDLGAVLPWVGVAILAQSLLVEAVDGGDTTRLVVASN